MVSTRAKVDASPEQKQSSPQNGVGTKRKAEDSGSPESKRGKKDAPKDQKTLEQTMPEAVKDQGIEDEDMIEAGEKAKADEGIDKQPDNKPSNGDAAGNESHAARDEGDDDTQKASNGTSSADVKKDSENGKAQSDATPGDKGVNSKTSANGEGAIVDAPDKKLPSNVIEKGIIYFITRGRVGVDKPDNVQDLQRSFLVLRPLPDNAKLGDGSIQDLKNNRLIAIPKKVLPKSHNDRFMAFVEKGKSSIQELKDDFLKGSEYETQTQGTRQTPPVTPVGEGVYSIITEGRSTHLVYLLTIPEKTSSVQEDMGIRNKGSFVLSLKNPERKGPASASLPQKPDFPKEIIAEFGGNAWMPVSKPEHLDYANAQFLLIGEGEEGFEKATGAVDEGTADGETKVADEMQELENDDELRVEHLHGDNTVYDDLQISSKDYPKVKTTW